jgi:hypothetical protein
MKGGHTMPAPNSLQIIDQIASVIDELRPHFGLGPVTKSPEEQALAFPLVAASDPVHPTFFGLICDGRVCLAVEWIIAVHPGDTILDRVTHAMQYRRYRLQSAGMLLGLATVLASNRRGRNSCAGWDPDEGNIYVRDSFPATEEELVYLRDRIASVIEHAGEIRYGGFPWNELDRPDPPESPFFNSYCNNKE